MVQESRAQTAVEPGGNVAASINAGNTNLYLTGDAVWSTQLNIDAALLSIDGANGAGGNYQIVVPSNLTAIRNITANNAVVSLTNIDFRRNAAVPNAGAQYLIGLDSAVSLTLNLEGSSFQNFGISENRGAAVIYAYHDNQTVTIDGGAKGVLFAYNRAERDATSVLAVSMSDVILKGKVDFVGNWSGNYGGAVTVYDFDNSLTFDGTTTFTGNHSSVFAGAIDVWGNTNSRVLFNGVTVFRGNYVNLTSGSDGTPNHVTDQHARGGALNIGYVGDNNSQATVTFANAVTFDGNYVTSRVSNRNAVGGAISVYGSSGNRQYQLNLNAPATFTNNYVYSVGGSGYGGAIFYDSTSSTPGVTSILNLSGGTTFTNNYASTLGGAIYLQRGDIKLNALNGNIRFQGNRQGVAFTEVDGVYTPTPNTGTPNAIYLGSSGNLNFNVGEGYAIQFYDPIASSASSTVTVTKTGAGEVAFYGDSGAPSDYISDVRGNTLVQGGNFTLGSQVIYGNVSNGTFTVQNSGQVRGGGGATLRTTTLSIQSGGALGGTGGIFTVTTGVINMAAGSYLKGAGEIQAPVNISMTGTVTAEIAGSGNLIISPVLTGVGGLNKQGTGTLTLNAVNTYTGATTVNAGTLSAGFTNAFAQSGGVTVMTGAALNLNGYNQSANNLSGGGTVNLGANDLSVNNTTDTEFSGSFTGSGNIAKSGDGTFTLSGSSDNFFGRTFIAAGGLIVLNASALGAGVVEIQDVASLTLDFDGTMANALNGTGTLHKQGGGTVTLSNAGASVGTVNVNAGTLYLNQVGTFNAAEYNNVGNTTLGNYAQLDVGGEFNMGAGAVLNISLGPNQPLISANTAYLNGTLNINGSLRGTARDLMGGRFVIIHTSGGITDDFAQVNYSGLDNNMDYLTFYAGKDGSDYVLDTGLSWFAGDVRGHGDFTLPNSSDSFDVNVILTDQPESTFPWDGKTLTKMGDGTLILSEVNTYSGATNIISGTLRTDIADAFANSSAVTIAAGAALSLNGYNQTARNLSGAGTVNLAAGDLLLVNSADSEFSGRITGTGEITKSGGGTLTLSGSNSTFSGITSISEGDLIVLNALSLGTRVVEIGAGTSLTLNFEGAMTNTLVGAGTLHKQGGGMVTLTEAGSNVGVVNVSQGILYLNQVGSFNAAEYNNVAATTLGNYASLNVGGGFNMGAGGVLNVTLGPNQPLISAATAYLNGTLNITGGLSGTARELMDRRYVIIHTTGGITDDFDRVSLSGLTSGVDYLTFYSGKDGNDYVLDTILSWFAGTEHGHGNFTLVNAGDLFDVDVNLTNRDVSDFPWDGRTLTKMGAGTLLLSARNSYSGATYVKAGTLQLNIDNAIAYSTAVEVSKGATLNLNNQAQSIMNLSGAGNITLGSAVLTVAGYQDRDFSGVISGNGSLIKTQNGALTLSGANTYRGGTTISAGKIIAIGGSALGTGVIINNSELELLIASGSVTVGNRFAGNGVLTKTGAGKAFLSASSSLGSATVQAGELALNENLPYVAANYTTANDAVTTIGGNSTLTVSGSFTQGDTAVLGVVIGADKATASPIISANSVTLGGELQIDGFGAATSFSSIAGQRHLIIQSNTDINGAFDKVDFGGVASTVDYLVLDGRVENNNQYTIGFGLTWYADPLEAHGTFTLNAAADIFELDEALNDRPDTVFPNWDGRSLIKAGQGTLLLATQNAYTGTTQINAGMLQAGVINAFAGSSAVSVANGAVLDLNGLNQLAQNLSGAGSITLGGGTLTVQIGPAGSSFSGVIGGSGGLTKTGAGDFLLSGANTYTGLTSISAGKLIATNDKALGTGPVANNSLLELRIASGTAAFANRFSGGGTLTKTGLGKAVLNANNSAFGPVMVNAGELAFGSNLALSAASLTTASDAATSVGGDSTLRVSGAFVQNNAAMLNITIGANKASTAPVITAASVNLGGTLSIIGFEGVTRYRDISAQRHLIIQSTAAINGNFTKVDFGAAASAVDYLTLDGRVENNNQYTVGFGLSWYAEPAEAHGTFTLGNAADIFELDEELNDRTGTVFPDWDGRSLTKAGPGTLILAAQNGYTGTTAINAGRLQTGVVNAFASSSAVTVSGAAVLDLNGYNQLARNLSGAGSITLGRATLTAQIGDDGSSFSGVISGSGGLTKTGAGDFILSGGNNYTGTTTISAGKLIAGGGGVMGTGAVVNNSQLELRIASGTANFGNRFSGGGTLTKTGAGKAVLNANNSALGTVAVNAGELALAGNLTVTADGFATANSAATSFGGGSTLSVGGAFVQNNTAALNITIGAGQVNTSPIITADSVTLGGVLNIIGFGMDVKSSKLSVARQLLIQSATPINGNFSTVDFDGVSSKYDYLTLDDRIENNNQYTVGFGLAWYAAAAQAHGTFTLTNAADTFEVDEVLANRTGATFPNWDGRSLTKAGAGVLILSVKNTYSGATNINAGTLQAGVMDAFAASSGVAVAGGAVLDLNGFSQTAQNLSGAGSIYLAGATLTTQIAAPGSAFSGVISGRGRLAKTGAGSLTLSGVNTYSGGTSINQGLVIATNGAALGTGAVNNGGALELSIAGGTATFRNVFSGGGSLAKTGAGTASLSTTGSTGTVAVRTGTLNFSQNGVFSATSYTTAQNAATILNAGARLNVNGAFSQQSGAGLTVSLGNSAAAVITAGSANIGGTLNVSGIDVTAPAKASGLPLMQRTIISTTGGISGNFTAVNLYPAASGVDYLVVSGTQSANTYSVGLGLAWQAGAQSGSGTFTVGQGTGFEVDVELSDQSRHPAAWDGKSLTKAGAGTLILSAANSYSGVTAINAGMLQTNAANAFAASSAVSVKAGAVLNLNGFNQTARNLSGAGNIQLGSATLTADIGAAGSTFDGVVSGSGGLAKTGAGSFTLTGDNTYTGVTAISAGRLIATNGNALGRSLITNNSQLELNIASGRAVFNNLFGGTGALSKTGAGTALLTADNSALGTVTVGTGELALNHGLTAAADSFTAAANAVTTIGADSTLNIGGAFTQNAGAVLNVTIGLHKPAASAIINTNSATLGGALQLTGFGAGTRFSDLEGQRHVIIQSATDINGTFAAVDFGGAASSLDFLTLDGRIDNNRQYTVGFDLTWYTDAARAHGTFTLAQADEVFELDRALNNRSDGPFAGNWDGRSLTKAGAGTLILSAVNGYTGSTNINAGTLQTGVANAFQNSTAVTVAQGAILYLNGFNQIAQNISGDGNIALGGAVLTAQNNTAGLVLSGVISGDGGLTKTDGGDLTLAGNNTYAGTTTISSGSLIATGGGSFGSSTVTNNSRLELSIASGSATFGNRFGGNGILTKTGAGTALLTADNSGLGAATVTAGGLTIGPNIGVTAGSYTTANAAATSINGNSTLAVAGAFTQNGSATLNVTLGLGKPNTTPIIIANDTTLGGALKIAGFGYGTRYSIISGQPNLIIQSNNDIVGNFTSVDFGGAASNYDFLTLDGRVVNGNQYTVGFGLSWQAPLANAHGNFTLTDANSLFILDEALADRTESGFPSGWDGKSLTKQGAGALVLEAVNTYSGATNISEGSLHTGIANAFANSSDVTVSSGATLSLNDFDQIAQNLRGAGSIELGSAVLTVQNITGTDFSGVISGTGSLIKTGNASLALGGANTYTGGTSINAGTLIVRQGSALGTGQVAIAGGATLNLDIADGTTASFANQIGGSGSLSKTGGGTAVIINPGTVGDVTVAAGTLRLNANSVFASSSYTTKAGAVTELGPVALLQVGGAFTQESGSTLSVAYVPGLTPVTAETAGLGGTLNIAGFSLDNPVNASDVNNQAFVIIETTVGTIVGDFDAVNFGNAAAPADYLTLAGSKSADAKQYNIWMGLTWLAGDKLGNGVFTLTDTTDYFNVDISLGDQAASATGWTGQDLTKNGNGTLVLSAANTYTGITTVNGGTLELAADGALGGTMELVVAGDATVDLGGTTQSVGKLNTAVGARLDFNGGSLTISDSQRVTRDSDGGLVNAATLYGTGTLTIDPSVLRVNGTNNDFTGNVIVADGSSLILNDGGGVGTSGNIELTGSDDSLIFTSVEGVAAAGTLSKTLSGLGRVQTLSGANITLAADNRVFSGVFEVGTDSILHGSSGIHLGTGSLQLEGRFIATVDDYWQFINPVTGGGAFEKNGAGEMEVDQAFSGFNGRVYVNEGRLVVGNANTIGAKLNAQNVTVAAAATLSGSGTVDAGVANNGTIAALNALAGHESDGVSHLVIGALTNNGTLNLAGTQAGNTLTVTGGMQGGGTLIINTVVGDDNSTTDRLILDGGATTGSTSLKVVNQGGAGALTGTGILVVEAANGATTSDDAFRLSYETTGYRSYRGTMVIGAYDYSLVKGGTNGLAESWYLVSEEDQGIPSARPETGVYLANREASEGMFRLGLHDRLAGYEVRNAPLSGTRVMGVVWARAYTSSSRTRADGDNLRTKTEMYVFQGGADVFGWSDPEFGEFSTGVMFGIGNAKNKTKARNDRSYKADGRVDGYSLGMYATWFENENRQNGFYVDAWLQHAWFDNENNGHGVPKESYDARLWSFSLEGGYSYTFYNDRNVSATLDPFAQVIYNHYSADTVHDALGTRVKQSGGGFSTRLGMRLQTRFMLSDDLSIRPYLEAGWLHNSKTYAVDMNTDKVSSSRPKDVGELRLGVSGQLSEKVSLSLGGWGQFGGGKHEQYGGEATLRFEW